MLTKDSKTGTLYVIATPIGNLEDITLRALRKLKEIEICAAEDTRKSRILFNFFQINTTVMNFSFREIIILIYMNFGSKTFHQLSLVFCKSKC